MKPTNVIFNFIKGAKPESIRDFTLPPGWAPVAGDAIAFKESGNAYLVHSRQFDFSSEGMEMVTLNLQPAPEARP